MVLTTVEISEDRVLHEAPAQLFIGGEWRDATGRGTFEVEDPATGTTIAWVPDATSDDAAAALAAADQAFKTWRNVAPRDRSDILRSAYDLIAQRTSELALLMTLEMGKPIAESRAEIAYANSFLRWYSEEAVRIDGRFTINQSGKGRVLTMRQPIGPCLFITPWNFPMAMGTRKIGPALAAGCTCVIKPAEQTPLSMLALAQILEIAGLPAGVLNVITAKSAGAIMAPLIEDPRVRKISFTGSTPVGKQLLKQSAEQVLKASMELGGNAPFLVFDDADLEAAVEGALLAKMRNCGQACTSANRLHVHESVAQEFADKLAAKMAALKVGRGTEDGVQVGPLIDGALRSKVAEFVDDAVAKGARALTGGSQIEGPGYFYKPTVLAGVTPDADLLSEEIFGPIAPITTFSTDDEAIACANATEYGLAAYVFTRDIDRGFRVIEELETGMIGFNQGLVANAGAPFGGVKQSGLGREGGPEGLDEYLETKYVAINVGTEPTPLTKRS